jgi:hypothetical protein
MYTINTFDRTVQSLCEEIDDLKESVSYWKSLYEKERDERNTELNERLEMSRKGIANALSFALCVKDDVSGNLVISKEDRQYLAETMQ